MCYEITDESRDSTSDAVKLTNTEMVCVLLLNTLKFRKKSSLNEKHGGSIRNFIVLLYAQE